jgi:hypothetical protein
MVVLPAITVHRKLQLCQRFVHVATIAQPAHLYQFHVHPVTTVQAAQAQLQLALLGTTVLDTVMRTKSVLLELIAHQPLLNQFGVLLVPMGQVVLITSTSPLVA